MTRRPELGIQPERVVVRHHKMAAVEPVPRIRRKQAAALPAVAFAIQHYGFEPWHARDCRPGALGLGVPPAVTREVNQVPAVRRDVTAPLVDSRPHPLPKLEFIGATVPQQRADCITRPTPEHDTYGLFGSQQYMQTGWKSSRHSLCTPPKPRRAVA